MHKKQTGTLGEIAVAKDLISKGYFVFKELGDCSKVDLIVLVDNKPIKIQVKAYAEKNGKVEILTTKSGPNYSFKYSKEMIDVFAIYVHNREIILYISSNELLEKSKSLTIRIDKGTSGQQSKFNMSKDYLSFEKTIGH